MRTRIAAAALAALAAAVSAQATEPIMEAAERAVLEMAAGVQPIVAEPERRRSMARTWGGVGLMGLGLLMPVQREACLTAFGESICATDMYTPGVVAAAGLIGTGVMLATVWSDVPAAPSVELGPGRIQIGKTIGW